MNRILGPFRTGRAWITFAVVSLLTFHGSLLAWGAWYHSAAWDEVGHLAAGLSHWEFGHFNLYRVNPPLVRLLATIPVRLARPTMDWAPFEEPISDPYTRMEMVAGAELARENGPRYFWLMTLGRWACLPLSLLGGYFCFRWARDLYGEAAGLFALALWCLCPNILAYGQLIVPDAGAAALGVAAHYCFWRHLKRPRWLTAAGTGLAFGLMQLCKTTWIIAFVLWPAFWAASRWVRQHDPARTGWRVEMAQLALIFGVGLMLINLGYGFEGSFQRLGDYPFSSATLYGEPGAQHSVHARANRFTGGILGAVPVPLPRNYVLGIDRQKADFERTMPSYLRGEWRMGGWWYYYLYALAIKVPLGTWTLVLLALLATVLLPAYRGGWWDELFLLSPAIVILVLVSSQTGFNHHVRYVLSVLPFLFIWSGKVGRAFPLRDPALAALASTALIWSATSSLAIYPHSLSYFNELVGGPTRGHEHLINSNIDWGQDLLEAKRWLDRHPEAKPLYLGYGMPLIDPSILGIEYEVPPRSPRPGWYMISVDLLRGQLGDLDFLFDLRPIDRIGYSMNIYRLTSFDVDRIRRRQGLDPPSRDPVKRSSRTPLSPTDPGGPP
jgi:hypothetical protein